MKPLFTVLVLLCLSCKKDDLKTPHCVKFEYIDICTPKVVGVICAESALVSEGDICGEELTAAFAGEETIIEDNAERTITRQYIRKL